MIGDSDKYVMHFGVRIDKTRPTAKLSRKNYLQVSDNVSTISYAWAKHDLEQGMVDYFILNEEQQQVRYTEPYKQILKERALQNFDINMKYFETLDEQEFGTVLENYTKKHHFAEITDLKCEKYGDPNKRGIEGYVYIMALGQYRQVYIGMTRSELYKRIKRHWNNKKPLDRLVFGSVKTSRISIDSFGALDTTRLFVKSYRGKKEFGLEQLETYYIHAFEPKFVLNRL